MYALFFCECGHHNMSLFIPPLLSICLRAVSLGAPKPHGLPKLRFPPLSLGTFKEDIQLPSTLTSSA